MSDFTREDLDQLSHLCRLQFTEEEKDKVLEKFKTVIDYVELLNEVETENVLECHTVLQMMQNVLREDEHEITLDRDSFLENAPDHVGGMVKVPPVIKF